MKASSALVLVGLIAIQGCASGSGFACSTLPIPTPVLLSPMPGATGVSTAIGTLTIQGAVVPGTLVVLRLENVTPISLGTIPSGSDAIAVPILEADTTYSVAVTVPVSQG
jgi:hypothetical protein